MGAAANLAPLDLPAIDRPTQSEPVLLEMKERLTQLENEAKANEEDPPEVKAQLVQTQAELMAQIMQAEAQLKREQNARQLASQERNERLLLKHMSATAPKLLASLPSPSPSEEIERSPSLGESSPIP